MYFVVLYMISYRVIHRISRQVWENVHLSLNVLKCLNICCYRWETIGGMQLCYRVWGSYICNSWCRSFLFPSWFNHLIYPRKRQNGNFINLIQNTKLLYWVIMWSYLCQKYWAYDYCMCAVLNVTSLIVIIGFFFIHIHF